MQEKCLEKLSLFRKCEIVIYNADDTLLANCVTRSHLPSREIAWSRKDPERPLYIKSVEKDDTDCMLAIKKGLELGCDTFVIYGGLDGKFVDHTMANYQALAYLAQQGCRGWLVGRRQIATVIENSSVTFPAYCVGNLSVFCLGADAEGVNIRGMHYEMENGKLTAGMPLGVSNQFIQKKATVAVDKGMLLLIWKQNNGLL